MRRSVLPGWHRGDVRHPDETVPKTGTDPDEPMPGTVSDVDETEIDADDPVPSAETDGDEPGAEEEVEDDGEGEPVPSGLSWPRVAVLGVALLFLGSSVAVFLGRDQQPSADGVDVGFLQDMLSHHQQAIDLSLLELGNGSDPTIRAFAAEVLVFQSQEVGVMDRMLHEWGYSVGDRPGEAMAWMGMTPVPVAEMPGMIPEDQVDELREAEGAEADALFLELMAEHHVGGIHMGEYAAEHADDHDVRELAARMARNQAIEINEYALTAEQLGLPVTIEQVAVPEFPDLLDDSSH